MQKLWIILLFIFCYAAPAAAQERYDMRPSEFITKFSFTQLTGGVIMLKATFNNLSDSLNFILDTGSGAISIDSSTTIEFKIPNRPSGRSVSGIAGIREVNFAENNTLHLPGLSIDSLDFFVNDYSILTSVYGIKVDGIIGYSFLSKYIVAIDYDSMLIKVYSPGSFDYPRGYTFLRPIFTTLPIQPMLIKDERKMRANFYFDTGAGLCFLLTKQFLEDSLFLKKKRKPVTIQVQGLGGKKQMQLTIIRQIQLGPFRFSRVPTNILDDEHNALSYPFLAGLVGNDILRRFNVILNYRQRLIALKPNSHYHDSFDYSYTGLSMYLEDGFIVADDIVKGSPADKGGLKNGDIIIAINNNLSQNITTYKNLLQDVGANVKMIVSRNGKMEQINFRIGRIY